MTSAPISVDLYVYASHEVALWESLWWRLRNRGVDVQFVVEPPGLNRARGTVPDASNGWADDKHAANIQDLMDPPMFRLCCDALARRNLPWVEASRSGVDAVVTTAGDGWLLHYGGLRVRTMYGVGAVTNSYGHGEINDRMDLVLVHGPFSKRAIGARLPASAIVDVGFPKWAEAIRGDLTREHARELLGLEIEGDPVIAWLPTWAQNSSLDRFAAALADLATDHRVITKPHHNNLRFEQQRLSALDSSITVVPDLDTLVPLVIAADIVIGDVRSGGVTEALLADRPVVGLVSTGSLDEQNLLSGLGDAVAICENPDRLRHAVDGACEPIRGATRASWSRWFFGETRGDDDDRAADAIIERVEMVRAERTPSFPLIELDRAIGSLGATENATDVRVQLVEQAWSTWPEDPRLSQIVAGLPAEADPDQLLRCARTVRRSGHLERCPLLAAASDITNTPDRRLAAAALAASVFSDDIGAGLFLEIAGELVPDQIEACVVALLTHEPSLLPAFVQQAGTSAANRQELTAVLSSVGADADEIDVLLAS